MLLELRNLRADIDIYVLSPSSVNGDWKSLAQWDSVVKQEKDGGIKALIASWYELFLLPAF